MIYIRVDANHNRGMGHLYRMLTLAEILICRAQRVKFIIKSNEASEKILDARDIDYLSFPVSIEEEEVIRKSLTEQESLPDLWIFDCLDTDVAWIRLIKENKIKVVCFDDTKAGLQQADLVINALVHSWESYENKDAKAPILEGLAYAIINPNAVKYRKKRVLSQGKPLQIAITMGGSDTHGSSLVILEAIAKKKLNECGLYLFTGPHFQHQKELSLLLDSMSCRTVVKHAVSNLHQELDSKDVVICAGGITLLEICAMGLPALAFANEQHEERNISHLLSLNACLLLGSISSVNIEELKARISALLLDIKLLNEVAASAICSVTDGTTNCGRAVLNLLGI